MEFMDSALVGKPFPVEGFVYELSELFAESFYGFINIRPERFPRSFIKKQKWQRRQVVCRVKRFSSLNRKVIGGEISRLAKLFKALDVLKVPVQWLKGENDAEECQLAR